MENILIGIPVKNCGSWLSTTVQHVCNFTYPHTHLKVVLLENDSIDNSWEVIKQCQNTLADAEIETTIARVSLGLNVPHESRHVPEMQVKRQIGMCYVRQYIVDHYLTPDFDRVLWIDADIQEIDKTLVEDLVGTPGDITVPMLLNPNRTMYDLSSGFNGQSLANIIKTDKSKYINLSNANGICMVKREVYAKVNYNGGLPGDQECHVLSVRALAAGFVMTANTQTSLIHFPIHGSTRTSLKKISEPYASSSFSAGTDKGTKHTYLDEYEKLFSDKVNKQINLLEIGVCTGKSLLMWRDYLPKAEIHGADIADKPAILNAYDRIHFYKMNSTIADDLKVLPEIKFDIIIDDGSHKPEDQVKTAINLLPRLEVDGVYVIEDVLGEVVKYIPSEYKCQIRDFRKASGVDDDVLIVITRA